MYTTTPHNHSCAEPPAHFCTRCRTSLLTLHTLLPFLHALPHSLYTRPSCPCCTHYPTYPLTLRAPLLPFLHTLPQLLAPRLLLHHRTLTIRLCGLSLTPRTPIRVHTCRGHRPSLVERRQLGRARLLLWWLGLWL